MDRGNGVEVEVETGIESENENGSKVDHVIETVSVIVSVTTVMIVMAATIVIRDNAVEIERASDDHIDRLVRTIMIGLKMSLTVEVRAIVRSKAWLRQKVSDGGHKIDDVLFKYCKSSIKELLTLFDIKCSNPSPRVSISNLVHLRSMLLSPSLALRPNRMIKPHPNLTAYGHDQVHVVDRRATHVYISVYTYGRKGQDCIRMPIVDRLAPPLASESEPCSDKRNSEI